MATEVNKILLEVELDSKGVVKNADQINAKLKDLGVNSKIVNEQLKGTRDASGAAGAAVAEFGRLISDAPYGIQAVTNNLSQLGSMFAVTAANAGGAKNAVGEMISVVFKAGRVTMVGWLIAFQAVIAAIDFFTRSAKKAKEEFAEFNIETESQVLNLKEVLRGMNSTNASLQKQLELLRTFSGLNDELIDLYEQGLVSQEDITLAVQAQLAIAEAKKKLGEDDKKLLEEIKVINEDTADIQDEINKKKEVLDKTTTSSANGAVRIKELEEDIAELTEKKNANEAEINNKLLGRNDTLIEIVRAQSVLTDLEEKYLEDTEKIVDELEKVKLLWGEIGTTFDQLAEGREFLLRLGFDFDTAEDMLIQAGENAADELQKRMASKGERNFFVDTFGISKENIDAGIEAAQTALNTMSDVFSSEAEREIAIETNKTNRLNDELKKRLANEQLSADERDKINQEIARNEAKLVAKENEINRKRFQQEKAINIALATVNTAAAATGVLAETKGGSFARIAGMIAVIGAGLAQIAIISRQKFTAEAMPSPNLSGLGGAGGSGAEPQFNVVGAAGQNQLAAAIASTQREPVKAYVVAGDVTTAQQLDRNIIQGASIG